MARRPTIQPILLQPVATPVDTYEVPDPPQDEGANLRALADALGKFEPGLRAFVAKRRAAQDEADALRGEAAFWSDNAAGAAEGIRTGRIPAFASPAFTRAYKTAEGHLAGRQFEAAFATEYAAWSGKDSADPASFDAFFEDFARRHIPANADPDILRGLLPSLRATADKWSMRDIEARAATVYEESVTAHAAAATAGIDDFEEEGLAREEGTDYDAMWNAIQTTREAAVASGVRGEDFDKAAFEAIAAKAIEHRDPGILALLDRDVPGSDYRYSDTPEGRALKAATIDTLEGIASTAGEREYREQERADKTARERAQAAIQEHLATNPGAALSESVFKEAERYWPTVRADVLGYQKTFAEGTVAENPRAIFELQRAIFEGDTSAIQRGLDAKIIRAPETLTKLRSFAASVAESGGEGSALKSSQAKRFLDTIRQRLTTFDQEMGFDPGGLDDEAMEATIDFQRALLNWSAANSDATELDKFEAVNRIGNAILDSIDKEERTYTPGAASQQTGESGGGLSITARPGPPSEPARPNTIDQLPPEAQRRLEREAARTGISPQEWLDRMHRQRPTAQENAAPPDMSPTPGGPMSMRPGISPIGFTPEAVRQTTDQLGVTEQIDALIDSAMRPRADERAQTGTTQALGSISAEFESGGRGVHSISSGRGDPGGVSYGAHQLASKTGTMAKFLASKHGRPYRNEFDGRMPGTKEFNAAYRAVAANQTEAFAEAQHAFITDTHYEPVARHAAALGFAVENRAVQEALYSIGVQHGGAKRIVSNAKKLIDPNSPPATQIAALYDARRDYVRKIRSMPASTRNSVLRRYRREEEKALALAHATSTAIA